MSGTDCTKEGYDITEGVEIAKMVDGKADIIEVARQSLCDPFFPEKAFAGNKDDIVKCCRCFTCFYNYLTNRTYSCAFNPVVGNELENKNSFPITTPKKVLVVGGGLVGCECSVYLDGIGKDVTILEMKDDWAADAYFMHKNAMNVYMRESNIKINVSIKAGRVVEAVTNGYYRALEI